MLLPFVDGFLNILQNPSEIQIKNLKLGKFREAIESVIKFRFLLEWITIKGPIKDKSDGDLSPTYYKVTVGKATITLTRPLCTYAIDSLQETNETQNKALSSAAYVLELRDYLFSLSKQVEDVLNGLIDVSRKDKRKKPLIKLKNSLLKVLEEVDQKLLEFSSIEDAEESWYGVYS